MKSSSQRRPSAGWLILLPLALVLAACGSTVRGSEQVAGGSSPVDLSGVDASLGVPDPSGGAIGGAIGGASARPGIATGSSGATTPAAGSSGPSAGGGVVAPPAGGAAPAAPAEGPSQNGTSAPAGGTASADASAEPVEVGYFISKNAEALFGAIGYDNLSPGNTENQVNAMVAYANAHGGLGGHPIEPVIGVWDATAGNTVGQRQAACAKWFEDHNAIAAVAESFDTFQGCSATAGRPLLVGNLLPLSAEEYDVAPMMLSVNVPTDDRMIPAWVEGLEAGGYFQPEGLATGPVIGVLFVDTPDQYHSFEDILVPTLGSHGYEVEEWGAIGVTNMAAEEQNALLRFRSSGVTHVMLMDAGGIALTFMAQAESQAYRPRYGMFSFSNPSILEDQVPATQLSRTVGIGWLPTSDVSSGQRPPDNATTQTCIAIMEEAGEDLSGIAARHTALTYCDLTLLLMAMADAGGSVEPQGLMNGLAGLGTSHESALSFATDFTGRRDGAAVYRLFAFDDACGCFTYTSDSHRF